MATPNQEILLAMPQKDKMGNETLWRLCVPHSPINGPIFAGTGTSFQVVWRTDLEVDLEQTQNY